MGSRTWIKVYCDKWLEGSISEEPIELRGVWISLLALAGNGKYGDSGEIMALKDVGFNDSQLAVMLKINLKRWLVSKKQLQKTQRIKVSTNNIITIKNWKKYQSEYERTSQYRSKDTTNDTTNDTARDKRMENRDKRIENIYIVLFNIWNDLKIITHKKLTADIKRAIDNTRKDYTQEEIEQAMRNYAVIVKGSEYYFNHKWTLVEFLSRRHSNNIERFLDLEIAKSNFKQEGKGGAHRQGNARKGVEIEQ